MKIRTHRQSFFYRLFSVLHLRKWALKFGRGYLIKGEELADEQQKHSLVTKIGATFIFFFTFLLINGIAHLLIAFTPILGIVIQSSIKQDFQTVSNTLNNFNYFDWHYLIGYKPLIVLLAALGISGFIATVNFKKLGRKFDKLNHGQDGDARLATFEEVKEQYVEIPDREKRFEGIGGIPVTHYMNKFYIDTNTVNSLILGTSRSGKGESILFPLIDILSRAEVQSSMVFHDPKGELFVGSKEILEKRGFEVQVLNIEAPDQSMSYNPLQLIVESYTQGDTATAQMLVDQFTFALFHDPNSGPNKWVYSGAQKFLNGVILALIDYYAENDDLGKITMYNVAQWIIEMMNRKHVNPITKEEATELDLYFRRLPQGHIAKAQYSSFSSMDSKNKGPILGAVLDRLTIFQGFETIAKMTSKNSFKLKSVGFPKSLFLRFDRDLYDKVLILRFYHEEKIIGREILRPNLAGVVDLNFDIDLKTGDIVEITYQQQKIRYRIQLLEKDGVLHYISGDLKSIQKIELFYVKKPIAVFMITPDYDQSKNVLASIFVKQLYTTLAQNASNTRGNKCYRRVHFILDEFGNMSIIESMDIIATVCLGRNILFYLFLQSYTQLNNVFGDNTAAIIKENCQNHLYIVSKNKDTHEEISYLTGERTVEKKTMTQQDLVSLQTGQQLNAGSERLITPHRVSTLMMGEMIVLRLHRQDLQKRKIRSYAIFSTKETAMPFRYEFLSDYFDPQGKQPKDFEIASEHKTFDLDTNSIDIEQLIENSQRKSQLMKEVLAIDERETEINEREFEKRMSKHSPKNINNYKELINISATLLKNDKKEKISDLIFESSNGKLLFDEDERVALLCYSNYVYGFEYYKDILNMVRTDEN